MLGVEYILLMRQMAIGGIDISDLSDCFVIAEIGHNHQGDLSTCLDMIEAAATAGVSAVKLQKRSNKDLFTKSGYDAPYSSENSFGPTYGIHREALEFGLEEYRELISRANEKGLIFFATAFDVSSADFLMNLGVPAFKIASGDLKSHYLLSKIAEYGKPMIISTGGANIGDIKTSAEVIRKYNNNFAILQCTAGYPPKFEELNLRVIEELRREFPENVVGYSGHDSGIAMATVAYVLGARIIEKHFTLNRAMKGTDHSFSLEPQGMGKLVRDLKRTRIALGDGIKKKYSSEIEPLKKMGKMIVASHGLTAGSKICLSDIDFKSPNTGISPDRVNDVVGKTVKVDLEAEQAIKIEDLY